MKALCYYVRTCNVFNRNSFAVLNVDISILALIIFYCDIFKKLHTCKCLIAIPPIEPCTSLFIFLLENFSFLVTCNSTIIWAVEFRNTLRLQLFASINFCDFCSSEGKTRN